MERISRMWRSGLSLILALCLIISACPVVAFAAEETINYVSLGDSMTNGYGFTGYEQGNGANILTGAGMYGEDAYPNLFADYLEEINGKTVNHTMLAPSGMRAEELNYLLDGRDMPTDVWGMSQLHHYSGVSDDAKLKELYQESIAAADVITMGVGNASFGAYMVQYFTRMMGVMGGELDDNEWVNLEAALAVLDADQKAVIMSAYNQMMAMAAPYIPAELGPINVQDLLDMMAYISVSFLLNYEGALDRIVELNPDVEIVLVGLMNTTYGMQITGEGFDPIPVGDIVDVLFDSLNAYIAGLPTVKQALGEWENAKFYYAAQPNPEFIVQVFDDLYNAGWPADFNGLSGTTVRERTIKTYNEAIVPMISGMFGLPASAMTITLTDVKGSYDWYEYENWAEFNSAAAGLDLLASYGLDAPGSFFTLNAAKGDLKNLSVAIYLALEQGMAESVNTMDISLDGLLKMTGDLSSAFDDLDVSALYSIEEKMTAIATDAGTTLPTLVEAYETAKYMYENGLGATEADVEAAKVPLDAKIEEINDAVAEVREDTSANAVRKIFADFFTSDALIPMLKVFAMFKVGDGMSVHPTPAGHANLEAVIEAAYGNHTAKDETLEHVEFALSALKGFLEEYGPEYAEQAYNYLDENGYIDMAYTEVENLIKYLTENAETLVNEMIPAVEGAIEALEAQGIELKGQLEALKVALELKKAELETAAGDAAEQIKAAIAQIENAIAQIEELIAQVDEQIEDLSDVLDIMMQTATAIAEQVGVAIENAEDLVEAITELVETLKNSGEMTAEDIIEAVEEARESVLEAAETLYKAVEVITKRVSDIAVRAEQVNKQVSELYSNTVETLMQIITELPVEYQAIVAGAYLAIEQGLEAAIALVEEQLEAAIEALTEKIEAKIEAKRAELEAILTQINACVEAKYNELKAEADKQIEAVRAAAEAEIAKIEAEIERIRTEAEKAAEALNAHVEEQIAAIRAEAEAKIAELEAHITEKKAVLESLYAELENAAEDAKEQILNQIEVIEGEIEALEQQIEDIIAAVEAEIEALNAQVEAIIAEAEAKIEALNAQIEAIIADVEAKIEKINSDLETAVENFRAQVEAEYTETVGAIEKAISDLETKLEKGIEELKQAAEAEIDKLKEAAGEELEKLDNLIEGVVNGTIEQIEDKLNTVHDTVKELMNSSIENAEELVKQLGEDLKVLGEEAVDALVENVEKAMHDAFVKATTSDLELSEESVYVALGDGTAAPESYAEQLAAQLNAEYGVTGFMNYAKDGNTVGDEIKAMADNRPLVAEADLITIGFGNVTLMDNALDNAYADVPVDYDWAELVGEELVPYVEDALADVYAEVEAAVPDASIAGIVNMIVEGVAYGAVEYALELPALISAIRAVNTDAVIIIVGQYNPMDGVVLEMAGSTLDMSEYLDTFVEAVADHGIAYSMITGDAIFVEAPEVETESADKSWDLADISKFFRNGFGKLNPSEDGDAYIANQILDALNITKIEVEPEPEPEGLLGDANDDGVVDMKDLIRMRKYLADPDVTPINMENADVNLDGKVDMKDIIRMRKHFADGVALG